MTICLSQTSQTCSVSSGTIFLPSLSSWILPLHLGKSPQERYLPNRLSRMSIFLPQTGHSSSVSTGTKPPMRFIS